MKKRSRLIIPFIILITLILLIALMLQIPRITGNIVKESEEIKINYDNLEEVLSRNEIIKNLPEESRILLEEYGKESNRRYLIEKGKIREIREDLEADFEIFIDSKYLNELTNNNYCIVLNKAVKNKDIRYKLNENKLKLLWKYRKMMMYRECFGF